MESDGVVTKEFLEKSLKKSVSKFTVASGSSLGDGYTCVLYSVDVWLAGQDDQEPLYLLIKCFPTNPARRQMLEENGMFDMEVGMYDTVIPALKKFLEDKNATDIRLPFAKFYGGKVTSATEKQTGPPNQLDNYLIMTDLRKSGGFRLRDRFLGFDLDHFKLVIEAQATLHAVSWAYKQSTGQSLTQSFPCISTHQYSSTFDSGLWDLWSNQLDNAKALLKEEPKMHEALDRLKKVCIPMLKIYMHVPLKENESHWTKDNVLRVPGPTVNNEESWDLLLHGDCQPNNVLFRYDTITGRPVEVIFIDLQMSREGDQFTDVNYSLYTNTNRDLRKKHLKSLLHLYYDTFEDICKRLGTPLPPGWCWEEFNRRFHRAQIYGAYMATTVLQLLLQKPEEQKDLDTIVVSEAADGDDGVNKLWAEVMNSQTRNPAMEARVRVVVEDSMDAGLI